MPRLSEKYIAGFLDSDGYIGINWKQGKYKPLLVLGFAQKTCNDKVLIMIQEAVGGNMRTKTIKGSDYSELTLTGKPAVMALNRIKNSLIIKRHYANACLKVVEAGVPEDLEETKGWLKVQRKVPCLPLPNFPPRKWMAGYFDGDGTFTVSVKKDVATISIGIGAADWDTEGIETIQKSFGGALRPVGTGHVVMYSLNMPPSKAKQILGYFSKYLVTKKDQAEFILGCAAMGHYRDGNSIRAALKQLKAQDHRLSEPGADIQSLLSTVEDKKWGRHGYGDSACKKCKSTEKPHYANGLCRACYHVGFNARRRMRQSAPA